jgi:hypothetical protein
MFDRDDMSVFSDERLSDAIASGLKKFYEDSVQGMQGNETAGDWMMNSLAYSSAATGNVQDTKAAQSLLADIAESQKQMLVLARAYDQQTAEMRRRQYLYGDYETDKNGNRVWTPRSDRQSDEVDYAAENEVMAARRKADPAKPMTRYEESAGARQFLSDIGWNKAARNVAMVAGEMDQKTRAFNTVKDFFGIGKDKTADFASNKIEKVKAVRSGRNEEELSESVEQKADSSSNEAFLTSILANQQTKSGDYDKSVNRALRRLQDFEAKNVTIRASNAVLDSDLFFDSNPNSVIQDIASVPFDIDTKSSESYRGASISQTPEGAQQKTPGVASQIAGQVVENVAGKAIGSVMSKTAGTAVASTTEAAATAGAAGGISSIASGILTKLGGPAAAIGVGLTALQALRDGAWQAKEAGALQGDSFAEGGRQIVQNKLQDVKKMIGLTNVSGKDLQNMRKRSSAMGFDIESEAGQNSLKVQEYAQENGMDAEAAATFTRSMLQAGASTKEANEQIKNLKNNAKELGVDFKSLASQTAQTTNQIDRLIGGDNAAEHAAKSSKEIAEQNKEAGLEQSEGAGKFAQSSYAQYAAMLMANERGDSIYNAMTPEMASAYLYDNGLMDDAKAMMAGTMTTLSGGGEAGGKDSEAIQRYLLNEMGVDSTNMKKTQAWADQQQDISGNINITVKTDDNLSAEVEKKVTKKKAEVGSAQYTDILNQQRRTLQ